MFARVWPFVGMWLLSLGCSTANPRAGYHCEIVFELTKGADLDREIALIRERVDERGIATARIIHWQRNLVVEMPGLDHRDSCKRVVDLIVRKTELGFHLVAQDTTLPKRLYQRVASNGDLAAVAAGIRAVTGAWARSDGRELARDYFLVARNRSVTLPIAEAKKRGCYSEFRTPRDGTLDCTISGHEILRDYLKKVVAADPGLDPGDEHIFAFEYRPGGAAETWRTHYLKRAPFLDGKSIAGVETRYDPQKKRYAAVVTLEPAGRAKLHELIRDNPGRLFALVLDGKVNTVRSLPPAMPDATLSFVAERGSDAEVSSELDDLTSVLRAGMPMRLELKTWRVAADR